MGITVFAIPIQPDDSAIGAVSDKRASLGQRMQGAVASTANRVELDTHGITKPLLLDLEAYVADRIPDPWQATRWFVESYLHGVDHKACVCGCREAPAAPMRWVLELRFSDCGGTADVSMRLAVHWAAMWWAERGDAMEEEVFALAGFGTLPSAASAEEAVLFLPVGELGYAAYQADSTLQKVGGCFVLDGALREYGDGDTERALDLLETRFVDTLRDGRCRCQMCMPDFDAAGCADWQTNVSLAT